MSLLAEEFKNLEERKQKYRQHGRGKTKRKDDYILVKDYNHPNSDCQGWIREHRLVMSNHLGRPLKKEEIVHHKNGIRTDNRLENLRLFRNRSKHLGTKISFIDIKEIIGSETMSLSELRSIIMDKFGCCHTTAEDVTNKHIDKFEVSKEWKCKLISLRIGG